MQRPLLILVTGDPIRHAHESRGAFDRLIREAAGTSWNAGWVSVDARTAEDLPEPQSVAGVVVTGSPAHLTEQAEWMLRAVRYLEQAARQACPTLGICFGHQLLGQVFGSVVDLNPNGREIGTVPITVHAEDALLTPPPGYTGELTVNTTHLDSVLGLPHGAVVLAATEREPLAAVRFSDTSWGVQFHPEIDGDVMRMYIQGRREALQLEGLDAGALGVRASDTPFGAAALPNFLRFHVVGQ